MNKIILSASSIFMLLIFFCLSCSRFDYQMKSKAVKADSSEQKFGQLKPTTANKMDSIWKCSINRVFNNLTFNEIHFLDEKNGWISFEEGILSKTIDGGEKWGNFKIELTKGIVISSISFISKNIGWASVVKSEKDIFEKSQIFKTFDSGRNWSPQLTKSGINIKKIRFYNEEEGWAVGEKQVGNLESQLLILYTRNSGLTWEELSGQNSNNIYDRAEDIILYKANEALILGSRKRIYKIFAEDKKIDVLYALEEESQTYFGQMEILGNGNLWLLGGADSREGIWGSLAIQDKNEWLRYKTEAYLTAGVFLSDDELFVSGHKRQGEVFSENTLRTPILWYSNNKGKEWSSVCEDKKIPELISFSYLKNTQKDKLWAIGGGKLILIERNE